MTIASFDRRILGAFADLIANPNPRINPDEVAVDHLRTSFSNDELEQLQDLLVRLTNAVDDALTYPEPQLAGHAFIPVSGGRCGGVTPDRSGYCTLPRERHAR